ncbi:M1 family metallopeptidase [Niastella caeni]|uniref:M1 family metallopeptidase n=1 Tax=Niastella caeni TaxID=2569763 RepID=UPI001AA06595|nr:M1 family metallopeptidase [Niastella caeni]
MAQSEPPNTPTRQDSLKGAANLATRTWWNVLHYNLTIQPDYLHKSISGKNVIRYKVLSAHPSPTMQIDLRLPLQIDSILFSNQKLPFRNEGDAWFVELPGHKKHAIQDITVYYSGQPKESKKAPWDGGFVWSYDSLQRPWISVACQLIGASVWYPCKVHLGDEPDSGMSVSVIVPDSLVAVSNGRLQDIMQNKDGTSTYRWSVVNPINNYGATLYIGKYVHIPSSFEGEKGNLDVDFWVLDYNKPKAAGYLHYEVGRTLKALEYWFGPYPFYEDGFKMVEAPYIGMEHQSAVAYGNQFTNGRNGFKNLSYWDKRVDRLIVHESAHEWFGNSITASDPADTWLQEGFTGYAEELAMRSFYGEQASREFFIARSAKGTGDKNPVISRYGIFANAGDDMYLKGWILIHMIKTIINNDPVFEKILKDMNRRFYHQVVTSKQIEDYISKVAKMNLSKVFDQYLRTPQVPVFEYKVFDNQFHYRFSNCLPDFTMPIKTSLTKEKWIHPTSSWQKMKVNGVSSQDSLIIEKDFYVKVKKVG